MSPEIKINRKPLIVRPTHGRKYDMGRMRAIFFADGEETDSRYSISEWWIEPSTKGSGVHAHADDHIFYILAGTLRLAISGEQSDAPKGTYVLIPSGIPHEFANQDDEECGFICINVPAGFEQMMPHLVKWFEPEMLKLDINL